MVGTIEPRKGHAVALTAFEKLWDEGSADELWIAGRRGWHVENLVERIKRHPQYNRKLRWVDSPNDDQLGSLYRQAAAVILASYAEGFGLPIVEAMRFGKPVIVSDLPVFRADCRRRRYLLRGRQCRCAGGRHSIGCVRW